VKIEPSLGDRKAVLLDYFRNRGAESLRELSEAIGKKNFKDITKALQPAIRDSRDALIRTVVQAAEKEAWPNESRLRVVLLAHHAANVAMLEFRHKVWPYEYMAFSRRVGELWEAFVGTCFHYPLATDVTLEVPPLFADVRGKLEGEVLAYIERLPLDAAQKKELQNYYNKVWLLVDAGEIKLELDMHLRKGKEHYNIDFKSGFSSNEKGNTNRLLVVASIYKNIVDASYRNLILVRSPEEENNHYLKILKKSALWEVSCGPAAYDKVAELVAFNLRAWIDKNIDWESDLDAAVVSDLRKSDLLKYLRW
jgi:hypothetical protein